MSDRTSNQIAYPCGCAASGPVPMPDYCPEHGDNRTDPVAGVRCMGIWLGSNGFKAQAADCAAYAATLAYIHRSVEEVCQQRATSPVTRARLRHALAGVDWRKAK